MAKALKKSMNKIKNMFKGKNLKSTLVVLALACLLGVIVYFIVKTLKNRESFYVTMPGVTAGDFDLDRQIERQEQMGSELENQPAPAPIITCNANVTKKLKQLVRTVRSENNFIKNVKKDKNRIYKKNDEGKEVKNEQGIRDRNRIIFHEQNQLVKKKLEVLKELIPMDSDFYRELQKIENALNYLNKEIRQKRRTFEGHNIYFLHFQTEVGDEAWIKNDDNNYDNSKNPHKDNVERCRTKLIYYLDSRIKDFLENNDGCGLKKKQIERMCKTEGLVQIEYADDVLENECKMCVLDHDNKNENWTDLCIAKDAVIKSSP